jgi:hypothetical protein
MKIYHYTSIKALALILKTRRIRFSRLDTVDDPEEYQFVENNMQPAKYTFVSCWTRNELESIPQWRLYGDELHGVRIGMEERMFPLSHSECRFIIRAGYFENEGGELVVDTSKQMKDEYFDVPLSKDAYEHMEILLGSGVTEAERIIVESLMTRFLGRRDYQRTAFVDYLRI